SFSASVTRTRPSTVPVESTANNSESDPESLCSQSTPAWRRLAASPLASDSSGGSTPRRSGCAQGCAAPDADPSGATQPARASSTTAHASARAGRQSTVLSTLRLPTRTSGPAAGPALTPGPPAPERNRQAAQRATLPLAQGRKLCYHK